MFSISYKKVLARRLKLGLAVWLLHGLALAQESNQQAFSAQELKDQEGRGLIIQEFVDSVLENGQGPQEDKELSPSLYIKSITLQNAKFLSKKTRKRLLAPYLHTYLNTEKIGKLVQDLRACYIAQGYPTTQVKVIIGQNLQAGDLKLLINIGFIEEIILNEHTHRDKGKIAMAFPFFRDKPLYLPYLEQGIDQINNVPSAHATLKILPGLTEGGSVILIDNVIHKPVRLDIGGDNFSDGESGKWRWNCKLAIDNLLSMNDNLVVRYNTNQAKVIKTTKLRNHSLMLNFSFPIGYFNFCTSHNIGSSIRPAGTTQYQILYKGSSYSQSYEVKFPIYKHKVDKGTILFNLGHSKSANYVQDAPMKTQNGGQTQLKTEMTHIGLLFKGQYHLSIAYEHGLTWFGAEVDKKEPAPGVKAAVMPKRQFKKINMNGVWMRPFAFLRQLLNYQLNLSGQYSRDEIISSHQFNLTASDHVRGFTEDHYGNKGMYCKQELSFMHLLSFTRWLYPLQLVAGIDIGYLPNVSNTVPKNEKLSLTLMSYALGLHYHMRWLSIDFTYAQPLYSSKKWNISNKTYQIYLSGSFKIRELFP
jgi:hemolysin activation/secretion protein